jgi:hypothetical protein
MRFSHRLRYDAPASEVHKMLGDETFREEVAEAGGAYERHVRIEPHGAGMTVVVDQKQHDHNIPSFAKKIVGDAIHIVQREQWSDDTYATLDVTIPGKPGHLKGTIELAEDGDGTVETVEAEIKVHVPLVAGKLEKLIANLLEAALESEQRVGEKWLREKS